MTFTFGAHEILPSAFFIMWPMHLQRLEALGGDVLARKSIFYIGLDLEVKVTRNVAQYTLQYVPNVAAKLKLPRPTV